MTKSLPIQSVELALEASNPVFLSAEWRHLLMLNYSVDPQLLEPFLPRGTELDFHDGRTFVSLVGFCFGRTRILRLPIPFHINFEEVNLRFYVRRKTATGWRRGVVFIREMVPRRAIAFVARTFYGEPYVALPMRHSVDLSSHGIRVEYGWKRPAHPWESISATGSGAPQPIESGSGEEFITEHYWGYTARPAGCNEYEVEHPPWRIWPAQNAALEADIPNLYGHTFAETLSAQPSSSFIADGSAVMVRHKSFIS